MGNGDICFSRTFGSHLRSFYTTIDGGGVKDVIHKLAKVLKREERRKEVGIGN